jgi:tetratricopeptide (TPR) repeat protein
MNFLNFFSIGGSLERAERALSLGRLDRALVLFSRAWSKLGRRRKKGRARRLDEARSLVGLVRTSIQADRPDQALSYCRVGRSLSLDENVFYELPCNNACATSGKPSAEQLEDLVAWACWPKAPKSSISSPQVERLLRKALVSVATLPSRDWQNTVSGKALIRLERSTILWNWPSVYCAEIARLTGRWIDAANFLSRAVERERNTEKKSRLLWNQAHCLYLGDRAREAHTAGKQAIVARPPQSAVQWRLAARLGLSACQGADAWQTVVAGLQYYPADSELLLHLRQLCEIHDRWAEIISLASKLISKAGEDDELSELLWLRCTGALRIQDFAVATDCAQSIIRNLGRIGSYRSDLCIYAAVILVFFGSLETKHAQVLFESVAEAAKTRIGLVAAWSAVPTQQHEKLEKWLRLLDQCPARHLPGQEWARLRYLVSLTCLACCSDSVESCHAHLQACVEEAGAIHHAVLHAYALSSMALASQSKSSDAKVIEHLFASLGAWAALLHDDKALLCFARSRYARYGISSDLPGIEKVSQSFESFLFWFAEQCFSQPAEAKQLRNAWELEQHALGFVAQLGGLAVSGANSATIIAGPFLASALGLQKSVTQLAERHEKEQREAPRRMDLALLANLLGFEVSTSGAGDPAKQRTLKEFRRSFSPLGPAAVLLEQHRFDEAMMVLNGGADQLSLIQSALKKFTPSKSGQKWIARETQEMSVECGLQNSKMLVGRVPIDLELARQAWSEALQCASSCGIVQDVRRYIGEIAVGRSHALSHNRTREERLSDEVDRRSNAERRAEASALMSLAWKMTGDSSVQGPFAEHLNRVAVEAANKGDFETGCEKLLHALQVNPGMRQAAQNFGAVVLARLQQMLSSGQSSGDAATFLLNSMKALRSIDKHSSLEEIQQCLARLAEEGSTPFFNFAIAAKENEDWPEAARQMIWCLRIAPQNTQVAQAALIICADLRNQIARGKSECLSWLAELSRYFPEELRTLESFFEQLGRIQARRV